MRREQGFTLVELLISMAMFIIVIASVSSVFAPLLTQFKQQSKSAETQIEGIIGLEILRRDIKHAGFGLPWRMNGATYSEAVDDVGTDWVDSDFNDGPDDNPTRDTDLAGNSNPPGAIRSDKGSTMSGGTTLYDSDVLVLKAANAATNDASQRWTLLAAGNIKRNGPPDDTFDPLSGDAFDDSDRVIVISPGNSVATRRGLMLSDKFDPVSWRTAYDSPADSTLAFAPAPDDKTINIIYGIKPAPTGGPAVSATDPRMPFNRTEYYIKIPTTPMPNQCAIGTGILYKSALSHADGKHSEAPVLDCVADFQVGYTDNTGGFWGEDFTNIRTAAQIRDQIRMVTVSILAQEGQKDPTNCTVANPCIANPVRVGPNDIRGRDFDFDANGIVDWENYRWKVYTITVTMENIG